MTFRTFLLATTVFTLTRADFRNILTLHPEISLGLARIMAERLEEATKQVGIDFVSLHKGKATAGEIVSVSADKMELKTAAGAVTVILNDKTKYEHGNQTVTKAHLQKGDRVSVFGTKLQTGELVPREVLIGATDSHAAHK